MFLVANYKDTLNFKNVFQSQWKMQRDRYTEEFSNALTNFQTTQRTAAEKEKASVARARAHSTTKVTTYKNKMHVVLLSQVLFCLMILCVMNYYYLKQNMNV